MYARHSLAWLSENGWRIARAKAAEADRCVIDEWWHANWPAIVRRSDIDTAEGHICIGLAMPPNPASGVKTRVALTTAATGIEKISPPLKIEAVLNAVGGHWAAYLKMLQVDAETGALPIRIYGSCALQAITGKQYITKASDIDLLLYPRTAKQLHDGLNLLELHSKKLPLDGEIVFPTGQAVAWKEWRNAMRKTAGRVLVKETKKISLLTMQDLVATFEEQPCLR
jgi:phosphoribosyl-dephospho-CoA transferase